MKTTEKIKTKKEYTLTPEVYNEPKSEEVIDNSEFNEVIDNYYRITYFVYVDNITYNEPEQMKKVYQDLEKSLKKLILSYKGKEVSSTTFYSKKMSETQYRIKIEGFFYKK